jgi:hypothetical protein
LRRAGQTVGKSLIGGVDELKGTDAAGVPIGKEDINLLLVTLAGHVPSGVVNVLGIGIAKVLLGPDGADNGLFLQIDDVDGAGLFVGAIEAGSEGVVTPEVDVTDGAAGRKAESFKPFVFVNEPAFDLTFGTGGDEEGFGVGIVGDAVRSFRKILAAHEGAFVFQWAGGGGHEVGFAVAVGDEDVLLVHEGDIGGMKFLFGGVGSGAGPVEFLGVLKGGIGEINFAIHVIGDSDERELAAAMDDVGSVEVAVGEHGVALDDPGVGEVVGEADPADVLESPVDGVLVGINDDGAVGAFDVVAGGGRHRDEVGNGSEFPVALAADRLRHAKEGCFDGAFGLGLELHGRDLVGVGRSGWSRSAVVGAGNKRGGEHRRCNGGKFQHNSFRFNLEKNEARFRGGIIWKRDLLPGRFLHLIEVSKSRGGYVSGRKL